MLFFKPLCILLQFLHNNTTLYFFLALITEKSIDNIKQVKSEIIKKNYSWYTDV